MLARDLAQACGRPGRGRGTGGGQTKCSRQAQLEAERADLVLEQVAQRLDQLEAQRSGRPPTLWWILIVAAGPPLAAALDHVGIERALGQEAGAVDLARLVVEDVDEQRGR